jgi:Zn-dependent protease
MRDPFFWSFPLGRLFGITVRVHWLFPLVALGLLIRVANEKDAIPGAWVDVAMLFGVLFVSVLLHELGHCFGARHVNGDASEVLLWPLGGLAQVDVPNTARAHFITAASGPLVNFGLCVIAAGVLPLLHEQSLQPPWNPLAAPVRALDLDGSYKPEHAGDLARSAWSGGGTVWVSTYSPTAWVARFFWVNYILFLLNVLIIGFPLDGGRMFQSVLWGYIGYRQATFIAVFVGFFFVFVVALWGIVVNELLPLCLAAFIYISCKHQYFILETGGDESVFGYDFSQGYTSLERDQPQPAAPPRPRQSWWQRWQQARAAKKLQREIETREADERRMDALLEKISAHGMGSLTDEERRFMKHFSDRYKNRKT